MIFEIFGKLIYDSFSFYLLGNGHKPMVSVEMKSKIDVNTKFKTRGRPKKLTKTPTTSKSTVSEKIVKNTKTPIRASKRQAISR